MLNIGVIGDIVSVLGIGNQEAPIHLAKALTGPLLPGQPESTKTLQVLIPKLLDHPQHLRHHDPRENQVSQEPKERLPSLPLPVNGRPVVVVAIKVVIVHGTAMVRRRLPASLRVEARLIQRASHRLDTIIRKDGIGEQTLFISRPCISPSKL